MLPRSLLLTALLLPLRPFQTIREFLVPDKPEPEKE